MVSEHVEQRAGVYYVPGTRVSLDSIVCAFREGCSPETIREDLEGPRLAHVWFGRIAPLRSRLCTRCRAATVRERLAQ